MKLTLASESSSNARFTRALPTANASSIVCTRKQHKYRHLLRAPLCRNVGEPTAECEILKGRAGLGYVSGRVCFRSLAASAVGASGFRSLRRARSLLSTEGRH